MESGLISIDEWRAGSWAYFLTHLHADHTRGLNSSWTRGPIYCSRLTAKLLPIKFPGFDLSLVRVLEIGVWSTLVIPSRGTNSRSLVRVIAFDAHHCPGAIMLLFRGDFGCMLYTGDFRWELGNDKCCAAKALLRDAVRYEEVQLHLDNTFCNPCYEFPPREVATKQVIDIITSHPDHDIVIAFNNLGKEDLLAHVSRVLKIKIWVWPERLQTMHLLGYHDIFTTQTNLTRVRAVPRYSFSAETLESLNTIRPTIGILPSGLSWEKLSKKDEHQFRPQIGSRSSKWFVGEKPSPSLNAAEKHHRFIYSVPYSDHSCFSELQEFVNIVRPTSLKGIVKSSFCYNDPQYFLGDCGVNSSGMVHSTSVKRDRKISKRKRKREDQNFTEPESMKRMNNLRGIGLKRVTILRRVCSDAKLSEI